MIMENEMTGTAAAETTGITIDAETLTISDVPADPHATASKAGKGTRVHLGRKGDKTLYIVPAHTFRKVAVDFKDQPTAIAYALAQGWVFVSGIKDGRQETRRPRGKRAEVAEVVAPVEYPDGWKAPASVLAELGIGTEGAADTASATPADEQPVATVEPTPDTEPVISEPVEPVASQPAASDGRTPDLSLGNRKPGRKARKATQREQEMMDEIVRRPDIAAEEAAGIA